MTAQRKWIYKHKVRKSQKATIRRLRFDHNRTGSAYSWRQEIDRPMIYAYDRAFLSNACESIAKNGIGSVTSVRFYSGFELFAGAAR